MVVNAEFLDTLSASIDDPDEMLLSCCELELADTSVGYARQGCVLARIVHLAVD